MTRTASPSWYTTGELADLRLPGVPTNKRGVNARAAAEGWAGRVSESGSPLSRKRPGRGGLTEYHASVLPAQAQELLAATTRYQTSARKPGNASEPASAAWAAFELLGGDARSRAERALSIVLDVEALVAAGTTKTAAVADAGRRWQVSPSTINAWFAQIAGAPIAERLPRLAPRFQGGGKLAEVDPEAWRILKSDYLRPEKPSFAACYNRLLEDYARPNGMALPCAKTLQRRMEREISSALKTAKRVGREALRRTIPPQQRSVADLHAMEAVNVDGHLFDVFVEWDDGRIGRPVMVGIQDVFSRKLLAHRIGETESTLLTRLAFGDLFRDHGIPEHAVLDNGRAFASKALTGGALTRFRFKVKDTDPTGVLTALGVRTHWTLPYRGSSKPIERAWRDVCEDIAKHPAMSGAYTGNRPDAKPENYRDRAIPIAEFRAHVALRIEALNARTGRRTEAANGGSFNAAFKASSDENPIQRASVEQLRLALLVAEDRRCNRESGTITLAGNCYWSDELIELRGQPVTVRFDPDNLHAGIHVYRRTGQYVCAAPAQVTTGFFDKAGAVRRDKQEADVRRKVRAAEEAADLLDREKLAELLGGRAPSPEPTPPKVVRPVRYRGHTAAALAPAAPAPAASTFLDQVLDGVERRLRAVP